MSRITPRTGLGAKHLELEVLGGEGCDVVGYSEGGGCGGGRGVEDVNDITVRLDNKIVNWFSIRADGLGANAGVTGS